MPPRCRLHVPEGNGGDKRPDVVEARLAGERWGVLSLDELKACGLTAKAIAVRVRNGRLHPVHRCVYAIGHAGLPIEGRFLAAVKACGSAAVLSHFAAGAHWELVQWDDRHPEVTVVGTGLPRHPGVRVHRTLRLDREDGTRHRGIPVTAPARTLLDLASVLRRPQLRRAARVALSRRLVTLPELVDVLGRLAPRAGSATLASIVADAPVPTRSMLEDIVLALMRKGGLQSPRVNVPLVLGGRRVIPDFRWPVQRLVVEADGAAWHDYRIAREDDAARQALLEAHGERVVRVTWAQAVSRPAETLVRMRAAGAPSAA